MALTSCRRAAKLLTGCSPHGSPALQLDGAQPDEKVLYGGPAPLGLVKDTKLRIQMVKSSNQKTDHSFTAKVRRDDHIDNKLDPEVWFTPCWRDQRIETKGRNIPADSIHS